MQTQVWAGLPSPGQLARTQADVREARSRLCAWFDDRMEDDVFRRFSGHFGALRRVLIGMVDAVEGALPVSDDGAGDGVGDGVGDGAGDGLTHDACRAADARLAVISRFHGWYASKYDQRTDPGLAPALLAADEVVRSCWTPIFTALGRKPPTGPLVYLEERYGALATVRSSVPTEMRTTDDVVAAFVRELPVPVVALPRSAVREPWWIVVAAHETGHHVQRDVPGLVGATRSALSTAVEPDLVDDWVRWSVEVFADAFAVLTVGPAATWAVAELQWTTPAGLLRAPRPTDRYPPPAVRLALLGELARCCGADRPGPGASDVAAWVDGLPSASVEGDAAVRHLSVVAAVARALVDLPVEGKTLREVCGWTPQRFSGSGETARWASGLGSGGAPLTGLKAPEAARLGVAGGVAAFMDAASQVDWAAPDGSGPIAALRERMLDVLPRCGPAGVLAGTRAEDPAPVADRLAAMLLALDVSDLGDAL